jgi:hypothetical protein
MAALKGPLLADDGAYLRVRFEQGERRVTVHCKVQLDSPSGTVSEEPRRKYCADLTVARDFALEIAKARSLPILWERSTFEARVMFEGRGWLAEWIIMHNGVPMESDATMYPSEGTARSAVEADASHHFHDGRIVWRDEPASAMAS